MLSLGIKQDSLKKEVALLKMIYKKLSSKVVWDIILCLLDNGGMMTETEIGKKLTQDNSNLSPHINFLLAINLLQSENGNEEQLTPGTRVYINERRDYKSGYIMILSEKFDYMTPDEFEERYYPKKKKRGKVDNNKCKPYLKYNN